MLTGASHLYLSVHKTYCITYRISIEMIHFTDLELLVFARKLSEFCERGVVE